uniref:DNA repair nuclease/redox regulator APEX1 n=1 Tax=Eptatretus burgeri TaxID=7764 RepID=A0A8C4N2Q2_EPTBU
MATQCKTANRFLLLVCIYLLLFLQWVTKDSPDILCLQEVKCSAENVPAAVRDLGDFPHQFWSTGVREGLHGVGLLCKEKPLKVTYGINMKEFDEEGRAITAEFDSFILVMAYVPNSGRGLVRLDDRERWDETFCKHLKGLQEDKPLVVCGDFNVAYEEIDLKNPKSNKDRTPGFTQRERDGFRRLLDIGLVDSFRKLYPDVQYAYTFWTYMMNARAKNVGWRLDYFLLSNDLMSALCDSKIRSDVRGSDHCPISLRLAM